MKSADVRVTFQRSFTLEGVDGTVPPGTYRLDTEEEEIGGPSFAARRRLATFLWLPLAGHGTGSSQRFRVEPKDLQEALWRDSVAPPPRPNHQHGA
jgi:hypothetical protein